MEKIVIYRKPARYGNKAFVFTIPNSMIKEKIIDTESTYKVTIEKLQTASERRGK